MRDVGLNGTVRFTSKNAKNSEKEGYTIDCLHQVGVEAQVAKAFCLFVFLVFFVVVCSF